MGIQLNDKEAQLILKRIDSNRDGYLTYTDIIDVFRPRNSKLAKEFDQRLPFEFQISQVLSDNTRIYVVKLFKTILRVEKHIEELRLQLVKRPNFNLKKAF